MENSLVDFFAIELSLRMLFFEPPTHDRATTFGGFVRQWIAFLFEPATLVDCLAIFPYYLERANFAQTQGLLSLRLIRLFRVFPLLRLGKFNSTFQSLVNVLSKSLLYLRLLIVVLIFGSAFFGSMMYYMERGVWQYYEATGGYEFVRISPDGVTEEISPFKSIPEAFWWFMVTATTVGYGDLVPTTTGGKLVATFAMLLGVLVIAFPVSVFSDLWSKELEIAGAVPEEDSPPSRPSEDEPRLRMRPTSMPGTPKMSNMRMTAQDMDAIARTMQAIDQSQQQIRDILAKYQPAEESDTELL